MKFITFADLRKICKVCLEEKPIAVPVTSLMEFENERRSLIKIEEALAKLASKDLENVVRDERGPNLICQDCIAGVHSAYLFISQFQRSLKFLNKYYASSVKQNVKGDSSDWYTDIGNERSSPGEIEIEDEKLDHTYYVPTRNIVVGDNQQKKQFLPIEPKLSQAETESTRNTSISVGSDLNKGKENQQGAPKLHLCPVCWKEFLALDLRAHANTHKALQKYLSIPASAKVTATTKFYSERHLNSLNKTLFNQHDTTHKCPYCNLELHVEDFRPHTDFHKKQDDFKCDKCIRTFKKLNHLNIHRLQHLKEFPYKCDLCNKGFVIKSNYDYHMLSHKDDKPHQCLYCDRRFSNPEHMYRHGVVHTQNVTYAGKYKHGCRCQKCMRSFKDKTTLQEHECKPVGKHLKLYPCRKCSKSFRHARGLYNHKSQVHKLKPRRILCSVCGRHVANLHSHMLGHSNEKRYQCDQCEKRFKYSTQLRQHLLVHSGLKPFICHVCGKAFNNSYNLTVHERIHKGDKKHVCAVCDKGFLERSYLNKHMRIHNKTHFMSTSFGSQRFVPNVI